jgi:Uncharacterized protein, possibly involved in utilization of glycolate and propanediol
VRGYEAPALIRADNILVDGIRLPYSNVVNPPAPPTIPFGSLVGAFVIFPPGGIDSQFVPVVVGGISGEVNTRFFPFIGGTAPGSSSLTATEVQTIISHAAQQANITRAAIRQPLGSNARVSMAVVDTEGVVLGVFRQQDAPIFGFDVAVQKARTAAFFSGPNAATRLRAAGFGSYVDRALADGLHLDGSIAFTDRANGFLHRPFFPMASTIQLLVRSAHRSANGVLSTTASTRYHQDKLSVGFDTTFRTVAPVYVYPGSRKWYPDISRQCAAVQERSVSGSNGISGDGVDQDDLIGAAGANGFSPPAAIRADQIFVRGVRLPFLKFPRSPNL